MLPVSEGEIGASGLAGILVLTSTTCGAAGATGATVVCGPLSGLEAGGRFCGGVLGVARISGTLRAPVGVGGGAAFCTATTGRGLCGIEIVGSAICGADWTTGDTVACVGGCTAGAGSEIFTTGFDAPVIGVLGLLTKGGLPSEMARTIGTSVVVRARERSIIFGPVCAVTARGFGVIEFAGPLGCGTLGTLAGGLTSEALRAGGSSTVGRGSAFSASLGLRVGTGSILGGTGVGDLSGSAFVGGFAESFGTFASTGFGTITGTRGVTSTIVGFGVVGLIRGGIGVGVWGCASGALNV